ncbi:MAG: ATP-binding protein, partial [Janthinobacterium sp.]
DSVLYHHEPLARLEASHPLIRIVRLAHLLCCHADDADEAESITQAASLCALDVEVLEDLAGSVARQVAQTAQHLGIDLAGADDVATPPAYAPPAVDPIQQRLSDEVRNMVLVSEVGQTFARQQDESSLLEAITRSARILFDFDTAVILLQNPTGHALVGVAAGEHQQRLAGFSIPLAKGGLLAASALECKPAFLKRDMPALGIVEEQLFRILGTDSLVCVPLVAGQRSLGVLIGGVAAWQIPACQKREGFLRAYANQAATALEEAISARGLARRQLDHVAEEYRAASRRVVHEVNNPLSIIKNYLSVLDHKLEKQEVVTGEMAILNEEIDRVGQLIGGLADLQPVAASGVTDCARVVDDVLRLFRATDFLPPKIEVVTRMQDAPCEVEADADMLKQILLNLLKNAVEALPDGGRIEVANRGHVNRDRRLYLELCVSDNGAGLAPEVLANLFSPVRSSKDGAHHGLGLSIVHDLVTRLHGVIGCRSSKSGTSFEILLPIPMPASAAAALPAPGNTALSL